MSGRLLKIAAVLVGLACALLLFHRAILLSGFDQMVGEIGDTRIDMATVEHWFRFIRHLDGWRDSDFFYPTTNILGFNNALILLAPPYVLARLAGLGAFSAFEVMLLFMTMVGFVGMLWFLRGILKLALPVALAGAMAFAANSALYQTLALGHMQMVASLWLPLFAGLIVCSLRNSNRRTIAAWGYGSAAAALLGALLYSSFYSGWFVGLQLAVIALLAPVALLCRYGAIMLRQQAPGWLSGNWRRLTVFAAILAVSLLPFLFTYLPILRQGGGRPLQVILDSLPTPFDLLHPAGNALWNRLSIMLSPDLRYRCCELGKGPSWGVLALFLSTAVGLAWSFFRRRSGRLTELQVWIGLSLAGSVLVCWLLMLRLGDFSLWHAVYRIVPGAVAIRAVYRFNLILIFSMVTVAAVGLQGVWVSPYKSVSRLIVIPLCLLMAGEQLNLFGTVLHRQDYARIDAMPPPPPACRVFALLPEPVGCLGFSQPSCRAFVGLHDLSDDFDFARVRQLDAVTLAQKINLPTVNGYSGGSPPYWTLGRTDIRRDYLQGLIDWADRFGLWAGLCGADMDHQRWVTLDRDELARSVAE